MGSPKKNIGLQGEELAAKFLKKNGYKIIERNFRTRLGEIDIIAKHKGQIVFAEVKTRQSCRFGHPKLAITTQKQRKISMVALAYLKKKFALPTSARFDVVIVQGSAAPYAIEIIQNAFELAYG